MTYRMQIIVDQEAREALLWLSTQQKKSASKIIRELVVEEATVKKKGIKKMKAAEAVLRAARRVKKMHLSGITDSSTNDAYIYR